MGVPKFFRYISERYPCLSEFCLEDKIPQFDNLYLDMNGIIHNCSHPDDGNVHFRITEEAIFRDIFKYLDKLFYLIKPQKLFFMAVDGVAPRAKMNQQRSRRFRSAKEAETLEANAQRRGEKLPDEARFDSNCITPGTEFMVRLQNALKYFVKHKISTNPLWRKCRVILSGHETPGEGEHKIMEYIRYLKSKSNYDPNTKHCLYGLDADLIILGLCTHELHFSLLREEVKFGRKSKPASLEETRFFLLHLGILREYLELEFYALKEKCSDFDIEKLIDDWILMGFLVGNDFIPHLPNLHISSNALPILYKAYIDVRSELGGYINECGNLNLERLEKYFEVLSVSERECFSEISADLKYFQSKRSGIEEECIPEAFDINVDEIMNSEIDNDLEQLMKCSEMFFGDEIGDDFSEEQLLEEEFIAYKKNYYIEKLKYDEVTPDVIEEQTECYIRALQWILYYYYCGVPSWEWFYPHHYAPFASDLKNFKHLKIEFELGKPFLPFEQLLAVLPAASKDLLPKAYRDLMVNSDSELIEYYPKEFKTDLNGKKQDWEAVVLIPFIDEKTLLNAMKPCIEQLSIEEKNRNKHGPMLQYDYSKISQGTCEGPYTFKTLYNVLCTEKEIWREDISVPDPQKYHVMPRDGVLKNVYFPGFPTMKHLNYAGELRNSRIRVFEQPSRNESMILIPENRNDESDLNTVIKMYLNKEVFIGWPHLIQAKVIAVSTNEKRINSEMEKIKQDTRIYELNKKAIIEHHMMRMGIDFTDLSILVHVLPSAGTEYVFSAHGEITLRKKWSKQEVVYPAQGVVSDISIHNPQFIRHKKVEDIFPVNSTVFMLGQPYLGCEGTVLDVNSVYTVGRIKVSLTVLAEPDFTKAKELQQELETQYVNSYEASTILGIQSNCLARITGSIFVIEGMRRDDLPENTPKINIGLQLKFPKNNEELSGYMRRVGCNWLYSQKAIKLVQSYYNYSPKIFELIPKNTTKDIYFESDLFPDQVGENCIRDLVAWLKQQDHNKAERIKCGTKMMEKESVEAVIDAIEKLKEEPVRCLKLQIKPHLILRPGSNVPDTILDKKRPLHLFDRVVVIKNTYQVPLGYKGTIVAIHPLTNQNSVRYDNVKEITYFYEILFDKTLPEGLTLHGIGENRVFKIPEHSVLQMCSEARRKTTEIPSSVTTTITNNFKENHQNNQKKILINQNINSFSNNNENKTNMLLSAILKTSLTDDEKKERNSIVPGSSVENNTKFFPDNNKVQFNKHKKEMNMVNLPSPKQQHQQQRISQQQQQQQLSNTFEFISKHDFLNPPPLIHLSANLSKTNDQQQQNKREQFQQFDYRKQPHHPQQQQQQQQQQHQQREKIHSRVFHGTHESQKLQTENIQQSQNHYKPQVHQQQQQRQKQQQNIVSNEPVILNKTNIFPKEIESTHHSTNVLRKMLGIDSGKTSMNASNTKEDNNMRQSIPKSPPQPPSKWRVDALNKNVNNSVNSKTNTFPPAPTTYQLPLPKPPTENPFIGIISKNMVPNTSNNKNYVTTEITRSSSTIHAPIAHHRTSIEMQKDKNYSHTPYRNTLPFPNGPQPPPYHHHYHQQSITNHFDITKGNGAFIPLQALKNAKKPHDQANKMQNYIHKSGRQQNNEMQMADHHDVANSQNQRNSSKNPFNAGKYPRPKIAAKFDHQFLSN